MPLTLKKRGKVYYARGTIAGQHIRESTGCSNRAQAEAWAIRRQNEILQRHAFGTDATLTFAEAALDYMETGGETRFLAPILKHFGDDFLMRDLDNAALNKAAAKLYPDATNATINRQLITPVRAIATQAAEDGKMPFRKFRTRKGDKARTRWLQPAEMESLLDNAGAHLVPILAVMVGTGARVGECLKAEVRNLHPDTGQLWLDDTKSDWPRMLKMPARARDLILAAGVPEAGALFRRPDGDPYIMAPRQVPIKTAFIRARKAAKLGPDVTPHVLRHTWATWFHAATKDFGGLLDLGGWRTPDMAQRYRKIAPDDLGDQLLKYGWDFTRLGRDMPAPDLGAKRLRLVK